MRLKEIRERVKAITSYKSEAAAFHEDVDGDINDALAELWTARAWTFRQREGRVHWMPDIAVTAGVDGPNVVNDTRLLSELDLGDPSMRPYLNPDAGWQADAGMSWVGQQVKILDRIYTIQEIVGYNDVMLTEPVRLEADDASPTGVTFMQTWAALPDDCAEILSLVAADTPLDGTAFGPVAGLPPRAADDAVLLRLDATGPPEAYIPLSPGVIPAAGRTTLTWQPSISGTPSDTYGFAANRYYELTWAFEWAGAIGPLAEPETIEVFPSTMPGRIQVAFLAEDGSTAAATDAIDTANRRHPLAFEGLRKVLFANSNIDPATGERRGLPCWRRVNQRTALTDEFENQSYPLYAADTDSTCAINNPYQVSPGNPRLNHDPDGLQQRIRLYPRPASADATYPEDVITPDERTAPQQAWKVFKLRYLARPPKLCENADTPPMPAEFHPIIVWLAAAAMLQRCGDPKAAAQYSARAEDKIKGLTASHVIRTDVKLRMGSWDYRAPVRRHPVFDRS